MRVAKPTVLEVALLHATIMLLTHFVQTPSATTVQEVERQSALLPYILYKEHMLAQSVGRRTAAPTSPIIM